MKIVALSDMHGHLVDTPPCDLLLLAGDLCPTRDHRHEFQARWLDTEFRRWLEARPARKIVGVAGNHDFIFQQRPHLVPQNLPWTYLQDSGVEWEGLKIYGSPWQPHFFDWAFNLYEKDLAARWAMIPDGTDVLVLHGPPFGYGDKTRDGEHVGSLSLLGRVEQVKPRLTVFGHVHEGYGVYSHAGLTLANVSILDSRYQLAREPFVFDLPDVDVTSV